MLAGAQSLHTNSLDETYALPTEESVRLALRTQQILAHETGVPNVIDPLGGSYYVEALTNQLETEALKIMDRVEDIGGAVAAVETGYVQSEIQEASVQYQREVESRERVVVGGPEDLHPGQAVEIKQ